MENKKDTKLLLVIMVIGFILNFIFGLLGSFFSPQSYAQMTFWQAGDSLAIMASALASVYLGNKEQDIAEAGFVMLGIAYGVSFASSKTNAIDEEIMASIILPLVPSLFLISFCKIFPTWLRISSILVCFPFFFMYKNVIQHTYNHDNLSNILAYSGIQLLGVLWAFFIYKDYKKQKVL